jgi:hypothetical protein
MRELEAAAPDVQDQAVIDAHPADRTGEGEARFVVPVDHRDLDARDVANRVDEIARVRGLAHRRRRDGDERARAGSFGQRAEIPERQRGSFDRFRR